ncbi:hypothetical protein GCM10027592_57390 [Spirosoma flavus]
MHSGLIASAVHYSPYGCDTTVHAHRDAHFSLVLKGGSSERLGQKYYQRLPGDIHFYRSGELHQTIPKALSTHINLELDESFLHRFGLTEEDMKGATRNPAQMRVSLLKIYTELSAHEPYVSSAVQLMLGSTTTSGKRGKTPSWVVAIKVLLEDRWSEWPSLAELSAEVSVHPVTISRFFPVYFNCTLGEYLRRLKIGRSIGLLCDPSHTLCTVAHACGFADQSHFIRTFKAYTGVLPKQVRLL